MSFVEEHKIENKFTRRKHVFLRAASILNSKCVAQNQPFYLATLSHTRLYKNSYPEDISGIIDSFKWGFKIEDDVIVKEKLKLMLELIYAYIKIENVEHKRSPDYDGSCRCPKTVSKLRQELKVLLSGNDIQMFDAKIKIEEKVGQNHPDIYLEPVEYIETIESINTSEEIKNEVKELIKSYYKLGNTLEEKVSIATRLAIVVTEDKYKSAVYIKNKDGTDIKLLTSLNAIINNTNFRHFNENSKFNHSQKSAITEWVVQYCLMHLNLCNSFRSME